MAGAGKTLQSIGDHFGLTRERIRQIIEREGITKIRLVRTNKKTPVLMRRRLWRQLISILWSAGYRKCGTCQIWMEETIVKRYRCLSCSNRLAKSYNHDPATRHKHLARNALRNAIRLGNIKRLPCEECGGRAEAHHHDYSKPLDVKWLCVKHHRELHNKKHLTPATM